MRNFGMVALRSVAGEVPLYEIELAPSADPGWIEPVCKMHAPYSSYRRAPHRDRGFVRRAVRKHIDGRRRSMTRRPRVTVWDFGAEHLVKTGVLCEIKSV